jgi:hypothetical protein
MKGKMIRATIWNSAFTSWLHPSGILARFRIVTHHPFPLLLGHLSLTVEAVRLGPQTLCAVAAANQGERRRNVGVFEVQDDRECICVDSNGLCFTQTLLRDHFLPAAFKERFPFTLRFVLIGLPGSILGEYNESQT